MDKLIFEMMFTLNFYSLKTKWTFFGYLISNPIIAMLDRITLISNSIFKIHRYVRGFRFSEGYEITVAKQSLLFFVI